MEENENLQSNFEVVNELLQSNNTSMVILGCRSILVDKFRKEDLQTLVDRINQIYYHTFGVNTDELKNSEPGLKDSPEMLKYLYEAITDIRIKINQKLAPNRINKKKKI